MAVAREVLEQLHDSGVRLRIDGDRLVAETHSKLTGEDRALIRDHKSALIAELGRESRRQAVLAMMADAPAESRYFWLTDSEADPRHVILALAIRDVGTCELSIPREKYDGFNLLEIIG